MAAILSAQCTDARVNKVTIDLFKKYKKPEDYLKVSKKELENDIRSCGTFRVKSGFIRASCRTIINEFEEKVPKTMKEMLRLKGVGRKTAAVVLGTAYFVNEGIPIDTHNIRVLKRLGLTKRKTQASIELDMMKQVPRKDWMKLSHLMIAHGQRASFPCGTS